MRIDIPQMPGVDMIDADVMFEFRPHSLRMMTEYMFGMIIAESALRTYVMRHTDDDVAEVNIRIRKFSSAWMDWNEREKRVQYWAGRPKNPYVYRKTDNEILGLIPLMMIRSQDMHDMEELVRTIQKPSGSSVTIDALQFLGGESEILRRAVIAYSFVLEANRAMNPLPLKEFDFGTEMPGCRYKRVISAGDLITHHLGYRADSYVLGGDDLWPAVLFHYYAGLVEDDVASSKESFVSGLMHALQNTLLENTKNSFVGDRNSFFSRVSNLTMSEFGNTVARSWMSMESFIEEFARGSLRDSLRHAMQSEILNRITRVKSRLNSTDLKKFEERNMIRKLSTAPALGLTVGLLPDVVRLYQCKTSSALSTEIEILLAKYPISATEAVWPLSMLKPVPFSRLLDAIELPCQKIPLPIAVSEKGEATLQEYVLGKRAFLRRSVNKYVPTGDRLRIAYLGEQTVRILEQETIQYERVEFVLKEVLRNVLESIVIPNLSSDIERKLPAGTTSLSKSRLKEVDQLASVLSHGIFLNEFDRYIDVDTLTNFYRLIDKHSKEEVVLKKVLKRPDSVTHLPLGENGPFLIAEKIATGGSQKIEPFMIQNFKATSTMPTGKEYKFLVIDEVLDKNLTVDFIRVLARPGTNSKVYLPDPTLGNEFIRVLSLYPGGSDQFGIAPYLSPAFRRELPHKLEMLTRAMITDMHELPAGWRYIVGEMKLGLYSDMSQARMPGYLRIMLHHVILSCVLMQYFGEKIGLALLPFEDMNADALELASDTDLNGVQGRKKFVDSFGERWVGPGTKNDKLVGRLYKGIVGGLDLDPANESMLSQEKKFSLRLIRSLSGLLGTPTGHIAARITGSVDKMSAIIKLILEIDDKGMHSGANDYRTYFLSDGKSIDGVTMYLDHPSAGDMIEGSEDETDAT